MIATGRFKVGAVNGGMITLQYINRGAAGMVTDGAVRDANETIGYGFPVVCGNVTPTNSAGRFSIVSIGEPVKLPGLDVDFVTVTPGDYILADGDGTVVVPQEIIPPILEATERLSSSSAPSPRRSRAAAPARWRSPAIRVSPIFPSCARRNQRERGARTARHRLRCRQRHRPRIGHRPCRRL